MCFSNEVPGDTATADPGHFEHRWLSWSVGRRQTGGEGGERCACVCWRFEDGMEGVRMSQSPRKVMCPPPPTKVWPAIILGPPFP